MALKTLVCFLALQNTVALSLPVFPTIQHSTSNRDPYTATEKITAITSPHVFDAEQSAALTDPSHRIGRRSWHGWIEKLFKVFH